MYNSDLGLDLVYRPLKKKKTSHQSTIQICDDHQRRKQIMRTGKRIMKTVYKHTPTFYPGVSATPSRSPKLNMPPAEVRRIAHNNLLYSMQ